MIGSATQSDAPRRVPRGAWNGRGWLAWAARIAVVALTGLFALVVSPNVAHAVGAGVITKALDGTQGGGFTAPNTFETGALVRYRLTASCNSNVSSCEIGTITDVLDPRLEYMGIVKPVTTVPINATSSGQTVTITLGTAA